MYFGNDGRECERNLHIVKWRWHQHFSWTVTRCTSSDHLFFECVCEKINIRNFKKKIGERNAKVSFGLFPRILILSINFSNSDFTLHQRKFFPWFAKVTFLWKVFTREIYSKVSAALFFLYTIFNYSGYWYTPAAFIIFS